MRLLYLTAALILALFSIGIGQDNNQIDTDGEYSSDGIQLPGVAPDAIADKTGTAHERITVDKFEEADWKKVIGDTDYSGNPRQKKPKDNTSDNSDSRNKSRERVRDSSEESPEFGLGQTEATSGNPIFNYIVYAIAIGIIGYVLFMIAKNISVPSRSVANKAQSNQSAHVVTDIKELEIDRLLREALEAQNFRVAIRIYYLGLLKALDGNGFINWKKDKSNKEFLAELYLNRKYFDEVKSLTFAYETVWYGDHSIALPDYERISTAFKELNKKLNTGVDS